MSEVPPIDAESGGDKAQPEQQTKIEYRLLEASAKAKENLNREADQRYYLRWLAVILGLLIIGVMIVVLFHMSHRVLIGPILLAPTAYGMTLIIVPIVSMTTIVLALLIAAFRGFKAGDEDSAVSAATNSARATGLMH